MVDAPGAILGRQSIRRCCAAASLYRLLRELASLVPSKPHTRGQSAIWRWADIRLFLMESGELISAGEAKRRVLVLENLGLAVQYMCTNTVYAGMQLIRRCALWSRGKALTRQSIIV
jgi:gentisate 1,2-dioxygenase